MKFVLYVHQCLALPWYYQCSVSIDSNKDTKYDMDLKLLSCEKYSSITKINHYVLHTTKSHAIPISVAIAT